MDKPVVGEFYRLIKEESIFDALLELAKELDRSRGWKCIPFVIEKEGTKYSKKPLGRWGELKEGKVSLEEYWNSLSSKESLLTTGIGVICGKASGITVVDIDDPQKFEETTGLKIEELAKTTLAVKTISGGYHLYYRYEKDLPTKTFQGSGFDIRNDGGLAVIPPSFCFEEPPKEVVEALGLSVDVNGPKYEWLNSLEPAEFPKKLKEFVKVDNTKLETKNLKKVSNPRYLSEADIKELSELFVPIWREGFRNSLTIFLLGLLYKNGIVKENAEKLIDRITTIAGDEEKKQRLAQVRYQYEVYLPRKSLEEIKGWKGITEVLEELKSVGHLTEEGANYILSKLQEIFKQDKETVQHSKVYVVTGFNPKRGYVNDTKNCFIASWRETQEGWRLKNIFIFASIVDVSVKWDPYREQKTYSITFKKKVANEEVIFKVEGSLDEILGRLKADALVVRKDAKEVLSAILAEFEKKGLAKTEVGPTIKGIVLKDGRFVLNGHRLPNIDGEREKVKEALELLDRYITTFASKKQKETVTVLKWALVSPFNWVKKQAGRKNVFKWLFLIGAPDTGKTTDAELFTRWIWNLDENSTSGSSLKTPSRLAKKANTWTFAFVVNEASSLYTDRSSSHTEEIRELLRQIWDGKIAREIRRQSGEKIVELAAANFIFTANRHPHLYSADAKRIAVIKYSPGARIRRESKQEFELVFNQNVKAKLAYIGSAVLEWAKEHKDLILEVDDFNFLGTQILEELYQSYAGYTPEWVKLFFEDTWEEEEEPTKEEILSILVKKVNQVLAPRFGMSIAKGKLPVIKRLKLAKNLDPSLPYEIDEDNGLLLLKKGFLKLLNEEGFEIASLIDLAGILGGDYLRVHKEKLGLKGNKVVAISLNAFEFLEGREVTLREGFSLGDNSEPEEDLEDIPLFEEDFEDNKAPPEA